MWKKQHYFLLFTLLLAAPLYQFSNILMYIRNGQEAKQLFKYLHQVFHYLGKCVQDRQSVNNSTIF